MNNQERALLNVTYWEPRAENPFFGLMETFEAENNASFVPAQEAQ